MFGGMYFLVNGVQFPGRESIDWLVWGLSSLVHWCFQVSKSLSKPLLAP